MKVPYIQKSFLVLAMSILACKKPPEVAVPDTIETTEITPEEPVVEETMDASSDPTVVPEIEEPIVEETSAIDDAVVEQINNAVALLSADETSVQKSVKTLEKLYTEEIEKKGNAYPEIPYNIGVGYMALEEEKNAKKSFQKAIELDPTFSKSWVNLAVIEERNGNYVEAISLYEQGLSHNPLDVDLAGGKIACLRKMKRYDEAIKYAQQVLSKNANNLTAYNEIASVYIEQQNMDKAQFILQQAIGRVGGSENAMIQANLGLVFYKQGNMLKARTALEQAVSLDANLIDATLLLTFIHLDNRAWTMAEDVLKPALELEPENAALLNCMGIVQRRKGNIEESIGFYKKALQASPNDVEPLLNLAVIEGDFKNQYVAAIDYVDQYIARGGKDVQQANAWKEAFVKSQADYEEQQRKQEARERMRKAREERDRRQKEEAERKAQEEAQQAEEANKMENTPENTEQTPGQDSPQVPPQEVDQESVPTENTETPSEQTTPDANVSTPTDVPQEVPTEDPWGTPMNPVDNAEENNPPQTTIETPVEETVAPMDVWGSDVQTCSSSTECGDGVCDHSGTCKNQGDPGTKMPGETCDTSEECSVGLGCVEQVCAPVE